MKRDKILSLVGDFTWFWCDKFFIETSEGNFVWSDPDYNGDNTLRPTKETLREFSGDSYGRCKGKHCISDYCGPEVRLVTT